MKRTFAALMAACLLFTLAPAGSMAEEMIPEELPQEELFLQEAEPAEIAEAEELSELIPESDAIFPKMVELLPDDAGEEQGYEVLCSLPVLTASAPGEDNSEELLNGYIASLFYEGYGERSAYEKSQSASTLTGVDAKTYEILGRYIQEVAAGQRTSTVFPIPVTDLTGGRTEITASELGITAPMGSDAFVDQLNEAVVNLLFADLDVLQEALLADFAFELYWYGKETGFTVGMDSGYSYIYSDTGDVQVRLKGNVVYSFAVHSGYSTGPYTVNPQKIAAANRAADTANGIVSRYAGYDDAQKLRAFMEEIHSQVGYNNEAAPKSSQTYDGNAWQLVWVFDGDPSTNVVCEGYAKAFQYLCDRSSFSGGTRVYSVNGKMDGASHMWNIAHMPDGKNYLIDVTNCDEGMIGAPDRLFLAGGTRLDGRTYSIPCGGGAVVYTYSADMGLIYSEEELALAETPYDPSYVPAPVVDFAAIQAYVKRCYSEALNRTDAEIEADYDGVMYWCNNLKDGLITADYVGYYFIFSPEGVGKGQTNNAFVTMLYKLYMNRIPDSGGLAYWDSLLNSGTLTREDVNWWFCASAEWQGIKAQYGVK